ncbi:tripartite tricarboxylate transporter substrate binding protein [Aquamicrobium sp. LC103]|uniref:Bug family tripartite tricarboxylate transporter substrate binding protein n=1 Tax=Aquamicrobium sp. LC103 TaxID=1120658 RepID=UPI00063E9B88|nr:tripartite tricarboxylate transporter substrate binding protein [Aquamicrobium sp. LC103]TKT69627.1 tripartite tricarboxylate transporter substrate binding protein [Aquamicrobium sp. LC103]
MFQLSRRNALKLMTAGALAPLAMPTIARAAGETIRIVYPYAGGSAVNNIIRMIADNMSKTLGQTVILEDKPGGNGIVATQSVARGPKDGTMVLVGATGTLPLNTLLRSALPYKIEDFQPVGMMLEGPLTVTVNTKTAPVDDMKSLVEWAKERNKPLHYATLGPGSVTHLFGVLFSKATGLPSAPVAYRNNNAQILDLLAGQNDLNFSTPASLIEHEKSGEVKMLAVTTSDRMARLPDTPTVVEAGYPGLLCSFWYSLMVPTGTPDDTVTRLNEALNIALQDAGIRERMEAECLTNNPGAPTAVTSILERDMKVWGDIIRSEGITLN